MPRIRLIQDTAKKLHCEAPEVFRRAHESLGLPLGFDEHAHYYWRSEGVITPDVVDFCLDVLRQDAHSDPRRKVGGLEASPIKTTKAWS